MNEDVSKYDDIITLPHRTSSKRSRMSRQERASQFSPFSALTGLEEEIGEAARLTESRPQLSEDDLAELDEAICRLEEKAHELPAVRITYFLPDSEKEGGAAALAEGRVRRIERETGTVIFSDGRRLPLSDILRIEEKEDKSEDQL